MPFKYPDMSTMSTRELLSLTLRENPDSLVCEELNSKYACLKDLVNTTLPELTEIKGIGPVKASMLMASIELAKRLCRPDTEPAAVIKSPQDVADLIMNEMRFFDREHFRVILLNLKNRVLKTETISIGTLNSSPIHPREVFKSAIKYSAASIVLIHNHPSGDPAPSREDTEITGRLTKAGELLGIDVLDHIIIGDGSYVSLKERGLL